MPASGGYGRISAMSVFGIDFPDSRSLIPPPQRRKNMAEDTHQAPTPIAEISNQRSSFDGFLDRYFKLMVIVGVLAAVALGISVLMQAVKKGEEKAGGNALVSASTAGELQGVVQDHAGTPAAVSAQILLSDRQWEENLQPMAIETLKAMIQEHPDHPSVIPARARLGSRLKAMGNTDEAREIFRSLADEPAASYIAPYALLSLAEIAAANGDQEGAQKLIDEVSSGDVSSYNQGIATYNRFISFQMPEEIDPPAPEETSDSTDQTDSGDEVDLSGEMVLDPTQDSGSANPLLENLTANETENDDSPDSPAVTPEAEGQSPAEAQEETQEDANGESPSTGDEPAETPEGEPKSSEE